MTRALILGVGGQDGAYLARLLVARGLDVAGTTRQADAVWRLAALQAGESVTLHSFAEDGDIVALVADTAPDQIYDLRGPSPYEPVDSAHLAARARALLGAVAGREIRLVVAGAGQDSAFDPAFVAARAGVADLVTEAQTGGGYAVTARLSEHASRLSGPSTAMQLIAQVQASLRGGALDLAQPARAHDWGWSPEYVDALWRMLQAARPADAAVATGTLITEHEFVVHACEYFGVAGDLGAPPAMPAAVPATDGPPGWRAFTHGRDLVRTLCEGAA